MEHFENKKHAIFSIIGIISLLGIGISIFYKIENNLPWLILIGIGNTYLFNWGLFKLSFKGRSGNKSSLLWLFHLILTICGLLILFSSLYFIADFFFGLFPNEKMISELMIPSFISIQIYFIFKFFNLLYKRLHDLNQPGYFLVGFFPIISWIIGIKIFKSGYKLLGILVFLNLAIGLLYILFVKGSKESNYFGIDPKHIYRFNNKVKRIRKAKSLSMSEKEKLVAELIMNYKIIEEDEKNTFINKEVMRLLAKEKIIIDEKSDITLNRKNFFENYVKTIFEKNYFKYNWC
jgi:uncharacterized membrane protein YhaH (DUF805 family)